MNLLIVDDHRLVADALQVLLMSKDSSIRATACYSTMHALSLIDKGHHFDLVLTDLYMPSIDGIGLIHGLRNRGRSMPIIVLSGADDDQQIRRAFDSGASGYIPKTLPAAEMMLAIGEVVNGRFFYPNGYKTWSFSSKLTPPCNQLAKNKSKNHSMGKKQKQVLELIAQGNSNKQISQIIGISEATVKYHTSQLFKLMDVKNRTSCVREAQSRGWINVLSSNPVTEIMPNTRIETTRLQAGSCIEATEFHQPNTRMEAAMP